MSDRGFFRKTHQCVRAMKAIVTKSGRVNGEFSRC